MICCWSDIAKTQQKKIVFFSRMKSDTENLLKQKLSFKILNTFLKITELDKLVKFVINKNWEIRWTRVQKF